ncbi:hypothetical protein OQJ46_09405, partial [Microbulbifer thermotolerans]|uniref:hypothetical protein n=1 Tax=Microbulbifer thermotolerans TaxID=252514 RepID=UPI00224AF377
NSTSWPSLYQLHLLSETAFALGLDISNVKSINLDYMDVENVVGMFNGGPVVGDGGSHPWAGAFDRETGTMYLFAESFAPASNLNIPLATDSTGMGMIDSVSVDYTAMENLIHSFGHETAHSLGLDTKSVWHVQGERMGMDAVERFRGMY